MALAKRITLTAEMAETMAIQALAFLADGPERLGRFLAVTGMGPEGIRTAARDPGFLAGVLEYLVSDEPLLLEFAAHHDIKPEDISRACHILGRGTPERDIP